MKEQMLIYFLICTIGTFALTVLFSRILIPILKSHKMGQKILDIGPRWHKSKEGTPTMGGIAFIFASLIMFIGIVIYALVDKRITDCSKLIICVGFALLNGLIGFVDDYAKFFKKQNQGLKAWQKFMLQLALAGTFLFLLEINGSLTTNLYIPFVDTDLELGAFYYVFALVLIVGIVNSVNLTDGIDGLASSVTFIVGAFFAIAAFKYSTYITVTIVSGMVVGATLGFLVYNFHPARVFMGDTGSLYLGGLVVALAYLIDNPLILIPVGVIYICESLSDIIQVFYFKITHGKRFFKMAPIHHHFEKCGWGEVKIVSIFSLVTLLFCVLAYFGLR